MYFAGVILLGAIITWPAIVIPALVLVVATVVAVRRKYATVSHVGVQHMEHDRPFSERGAEWLEAKTRCDWCGAPPQVGRHCRWCGTALA